MMADTPTPTPGAVIDRRPTPAGVLPRSTQTWVMVAIAVGIVVVILLTGRSEPPPRTAATAPQPPAAASPTRMREVQDQLRLMNERAQEQAAADATADMAQGLDEPMMAAQPPPPDAIAEERKRRDYNSLFASNVVGSRRPAATQPLGGPSDAGARRGTAVTDPSPIGAMPSIQDTAEAVVRATARLNPAAGAPGTPPSGTANFPTPPSAGQAQPGASAATPTVPRRTDPITATGPLHRILEGTVIDAVLTNRLDGSSASPVNALVTNPIYSHNGQHVLIPAGARVLGETKPVQNFGETRLAVGFHRLLFPDGSTVSLDQFKGLNQVGDNGLHDKVNQHYWSTFGAAAAVGLITGFSQYLGNAGFGGNGDGDNTVVIAGAADATAQATAQVMNRFLNRLPTITIREGIRLKVYLTSDFDLPVYTTPTLGGRIPPSP